ncbi:MAG: hypothetical protein K2O20_10195, partial [Duncaniella sp.]|nr:hypothetical protein [Duncaniella sp.]
VRRTPATLNASERLCFRNPRVSESPQGRAMPGGTRHYPLPLPRRGWITTSLVKHTCRNAPTA